MDSSSAIEAVSSLTSFRERSEQLQRAVAGTDLGFHFLDEVAVTDQVGSGRQRLEEWPDGMPAIAPMWIGGLGILLKSPLTKPSILRYFATSRIERDCSGVLLGGSLPSTQNFVVRI